jgi:twitching motility protein PilT
MLDHINRTRRAHIVTIEDPIEFVHPSRGCVITQREIGMHSPSFTVALRDAIREDPDVILVGEMRDMETISLALTAAETGAQVLGTLHTSGAPKTVDRILNVFPARRQDQIRTMLAESLTLLVSQQLVRVSGEGNRRRAAVEILVNTPAAASVIRAGSSHKLLSVIQAGAKVGMQSLDAVLKDLVHKGSISAQEAFEKAVDRAQFERLVTREEAA